jgi:hypothetical protein
MKQLIETLRQVTTHGLASIIAKSDVGTRLTKKARSDKSELPQWSIGLYSISRTVVSVNHDYNKAVNNQIKKSGNDTDFQADESSVSIPIEDFPNSILRQGRSNPDQFYVRVFVDLTVKTKNEIYYFNSLGENVTDKVTEQFKDDFFPKVSGSTKQMLHGAEKEVKPREYKIENILYFQKGNVVYNGLLPEHYELFNLENVVE